MTGIKMSIEDYEELLERLKMKDAQDSVKIELSHSDVKVFISLVKYEIADLKFWKERED
jgi:hypothetical protein